MSQSFDSKGQIPVVHFVNRWLPLTENWIYNQVRFLPNEIEAHVVCKKTENLEQFYSPHIHSLSKTSKFRQFWDRGLVKVGARHHFGYLVDVARRTGAQVLHSHFGEFGWANLEAANKAGLKHVVTFYGYDVNFLPKSDSRWLGRYHKLFSKVDCVLCEGPFMADSIVALGCPAEKVTVQHLGVRLDEIPFRPRRWRPREPLRVLMAASFREKKGLTYAIRALGLIRHEVSLEITIIGDASMEESSLREKGRILKAIEETGLQEQVRFLGYQPHAMMLEEAYRHHVFLSPSVTASDGDSEGGVPVSIIEMAASGMPVVATRHCDIPEVVLQGVSGLLAAERDAEGLAELLREMVRRPEVWPEMAMAGRVHIEKEYDARKQGVRLAETYRELLNS